MVPVEALCPKKASNTMIPTQYNLCSKLSLTVSAGVWGRGLLIKLRSWAANAVGGTKDTSNYHSLFIAQGIAQRTKDAF
jgi:hypothetical protein